jgi:putative membrane protein
MKNKLRALFAFFACGLLLAQLTLPALAADARKDETVYVNLNYDGSVESTIVVNVFQVGQSGTIYDYGNYSEIRNLSGTGTPTVEGNLIVWTAEPGSTFYYRGTMKNAQLPWNFSIRYYLDGKQAKATELIGAEGRLEIVIEAEASSAADSYFGNNYAAQISVPLEEASCKNVISDAEIVTAGGLKTCAFTVMPGASEQCTVSADISGFEMDGISIQMVRLSGSMLDSLELFKTAISQISDGIGSLSDGTGQLKDPVSDLAAGLDLVGSGTEDLAEMGAVIYAQMGDMESGAGDIRDGMAQLSDASGQFREGLLQLDENAYEFEKGYGQIEAGLKQMTDSREAGGRRGEAARG